MRSVAAASAVAAAVAMVVAALVLVAHPAAAAGAGVMSAEACTYDTQLGAVYDLSYLNFPGAYVCVVCVLCVCCVCVCVRVRE